MDQPLQTLLHLYGEADGPVPADDPDAQALTEARFWMDHRPRVRPDATTLDAIFSAAESAHVVAPGARHPDRAPVARRRTRRASVLVGVALSVVAAVAVLPMVLTGPAPSAVPETVAVEAPVQKAPASAQRAEPVEAEVFSPAEAPPPEATPARPAVSLAWEGDRAHLDAVARKTAELRARLDSTLWDAPAADLSLQGNRQVGRYTQASTGGQ